jgi:DNA-binding LytR/AlgR family response regulator
MLRIAVCDDLIDELSNMVQLINQYRTERNIDFEYAAFTNGLSLISVLEKGKRFDIYCMDIIMPGFTGIEAAKAVREFDKTAPILFFTSSHDFALESYSVKAVNYVLKPVTKEKLFFTFDDLLERINAEKNNDSIIVKSHEGILKILIANLVFVEVNGRNVMYHLVSGKVIECTEQFSTVSEKLSGYKRFLKTHRSYMINMQYVDTIDNNGVTLQTRASVPIAQGKARDIKQKYLAFQMEGE